MFATCFLARFVWIFRPWFDWACNCLPNCAVSCRQCVWLIDDQDHLMTRACYRVVAQKVAGAYLNCRPPPYRCTSEISTCARAMASLAATGVTQQAVHTLNDTEYLAYRYTAPTGAEQPCVVFIHGKFALVYDRWGVGVRAFTNAVEGPTNQSLTRRAYLVQVCAVT